MPTARRDYQVDCPGCGEKPLRGQEVVHVNVGGPHPHGWWHRPCFQWRVSAYSRELDESLPSERPLQ